MSFVGDTPTFYDDLTAAEHLDLVLKANRISYANDVSYLMEVMGLSKHSNQVPSAYSRGMRQKLALVLALLMKPPLLLLVESAFTHTGGVVRILWCDLP